MEPTQEKQADLIQKPLFNTTVHKTEDEFGVTPLEKKIESQDVMQREIVSQKEDLSKALVLYEPEKYKSIWNPPTAVPVNSEKFDLSKLTDPKVLEKVRGQMEQQAFDNMFKASSHINPFMQSDLEKQIKNGGLTVSPEIMEMIEKKTESETTKTEEVIKEIQDEKKDVSQKGAEKESEPAVQKTVINNKPIAPGLILYINSVFRKLIPKPKKEGEKPVITGTPAYKNAINALQTLFHAITSKDKADIDEKYEDAKAAVETYIEEQKEKLFFLRDRDKRKEMIKLDKMLDYTRIGDLTQAPVPNDYMGAIPKYYKMMLSDTDSASDSYDNVRMSVVRFMNMNHHSIDDNYNTSLEAAITALESYKATHRAEPFTYKGKRRILLVNNLLGSFKFYKRQLAKNPRLFMLRYDKDKIKGYKTFGTGDGNDTEYTIVYKTEEDIIKEKQEKEQKKDEKSDLIQDEKQEEKQEEQIKPSVKNIDECNQILEKLFSGKINMSPKKTTVPIYGDYYREKQGITVFGFYQEDVEFANEYSNIPSEIKMNSNALELTNFLQINYMRLTDKERAHLYFRINSLNKINRIEQDINKEGSDIYSSHKMPELAISKDKNMRVLKIPPTESQDHSLSCWSASLACFLKGLGVDINQRDIRAYRPKGVSIDSRFGKELQKNEMSSAKDMHELITKLTRNVLVHSVQINTPHPDIPIAENEIQISQAKIQETIFNAINTCHSPVCMLFNGHYRTIIGYDEKGIIYYDSLGYKKGNVSENNLPKKMTYEDVFKYTPPAELLWGERITKDAKGSYESFAKRYGKHPGTNVPQLVTEKDGSLSRFFTANAYINNKPELKNVFDNESLSTVLGKKKDEVELIAYRENMTNNKPNDYITYAYKAPAESSDFAIASERTEELKKNLDMISIDETDFLPKHITGEP